MNSTPLQGISNEQKLDELRQDLKDWKRDIEYIIENTPVRSIREKALITLYEIDKRLEEL